MNTPEWKVTKSLLLSLLISCPSNPLPSDELAAKLIKTCPPDNQPDREAAWIQRAERVIAILQSEYEAAWARKVDEEAEELFWKNDHYNQWRPWELDG